MKDEKLRLIRFLPAIIFVFVSLACIMAGWFIGKTGVFGLFSPGEYPAEGGIVGGLSGWMLAGFLCFGSIGLITSWGWHQRYSSFKLKHFLVLTLSWMVIPVVIFPFLLSFILIFF